MNKMIGNCLVRKTWLQDTYATLLFEKKKNCKQISFAQIKFSHKMKKSPNISKRCVHIHNLDDSLNFVHISCRYYFRIVIFNQNWAIFIKSVDVIKPASCLIQTNYTVLISLSLSPSIHTSMTEKITEEETKINVVIEYLLWSVQR